MIKRPIFPDFSQKPELDPWLFVWLVGVALLALAWVVGKWIARC